MEAVREWWSGEGRLLTLFGVGGIGKTSLAQWFAGEMQAAGTLLATVDARGIHTASAFRQAVAEQLGLEKADADAIPDALSEHGRVLLILDDLDAVAQAAAATIEPWLAASSVRVLATSRSRLRIAAEEILPLTPLNEADAVALLRRRSRWPEGPVLHELARRLEGLPLALELAASHGPLMPARVVLARLDELLDHPATSAPSHHRSMSAALDQSWSCLGPGARAALVAVAALGGPLSLEAAEAAVGTPTAVVDLVGLVDASLLRWEGDHIGMFATVRHYALNQAPVADHEAARERVGAWLEDVGVPAVGAAHFGTEGAVIRGLLSLQALSTLVDRAPGGTDQAALLMWLQCHVVWTSTPSPVLAGRLAEALQPGPPSDSARGRLVGLNLRAAARSGDRGATERLERELLELVDRVDPAVESRLWTIWATADLPRRSVVEVADRALARTTLPQFRARLLTVRGKALALAGQRSEAQRDMDAAEQAFLDLGDPGGQAWGETARTGLVETWDDVRALVRRVDRLLEVLAPGPARTKLAAIRHNWAIRLMLPGAVAAATETLQHLARIAHWYDAAVLVEHIGMAAAIDGDESAARRHLDRAVAWSTATRSANLRFHRRAIARCSLLWGEPQTTIDILTELPEDEDTHAFLGLAWAALGDDARARDHLARMESEALRSLLDGNRDPAVLDDLDFRLSSKLLIKVLDETDIALP